MCFSYHLFGSFCVCVGLLVDYLKLLFVPCICVCWLILIIWSCLFRKYLCRGKLQIGKILLALSHCLSSIQQLVSLKRTMPVMLLQLSWPVSRQKLRCLNSVSFVMWMCLRVLCINIGINIVTVKFLLS